MAMVTASVSSVQISVMRFTSRSRARRSAEPPGAEWPGVRPTAMAPASGITPATVSQGKLLILDSAPHLGLDPYQQESADYEHGADQHRQCVGADEPGLDPADPARTAAHGGGDGIHQPVDATVIEVDRQPGEPLARPHQYRLIDRVAVQVPS